MLVNALNTSASLAEKTKETRAAIGQAKDVLKSFMVQKKLNYIQLGESCYIVLEKKASKPSLNDQLLGVVYRRFCASTLKRQATDDEVNAFVATANLCRDRLSETKLDARVSKTKPVEALLGE